VVLVQVVYLVSHGGSLGVLVCFLRRSFAATPLFWAILYRYILFNLLSY
jgi:uncharacterized membrane protein